LKDQLLQKLRQFKKSIVRKKRTVQSGELEIKVSVEQNTIWLRRDEKSLLLNKDRTVISRHINDILKDNKQILKLNQ